MFLGHFGVALAAKRAAPRASLGWLQFGAQFLDELWPILVLAGVESVRVVPGLMAANPLDFESYPWSHSLLMAVVWSVLLGALYASWRKYRRGGVVVGLLVLSHWLLDLPMHRPDLPLWPGGASPKVGLGLWSSLPASVVVEVALFVAGIVLYERATRSVDRIGRWGFYAMIAVVGVIYLAGIWSPPPADGRAVAMGALGLWLFVPWAWWVDRHRVFAVGEAGYAHLVPRRGDASAELTRSRSS